MFFFFVLSFYHLIDTDSVTWVGVQKRFFRSLSSVDLFLFVYIEGWHIGSRLSPPRRVAQSGIDPSISGSRQPRNDVSLLFFFPPFSLLFSFVLFPSRFYRFSSCSFVPLFLFSFIPCWHKSTDQPPFLPHAVTEVQPYTVRVCIYIIYI